MISREKHFAGVKFLEEHNPKEAFFSFLTAYEINDADNEYGHLFRMAMTLATLQHFKMAQTLFKACYYNIKSEILWSEYLRVMYSRLTNQQIREFSQMCYTLNFKQSIYENYVKILLNITALKQLDNKDYSTDLKLLNYKLISNNSKKLIIAFTSRGPMRFQHVNLLRDCKSDRLYVRDVSDAWYNKGLKFLTTDIDSTVEYLKNLSKNYSEICCIGSSSGGYAALLFGSLLQAKKILAFSPQTLIPRGKPFTDEKLLTGIDKKYFDIKPFINTACDIKIFYSNEYRYDMESAIRLKNFSNIQLRPFDFGENHNVVPFLIKNGVYFHEINEFDNEQ